MEVADEDLARIGPETSSGRFCKHSTQNPQEVYELKREQESEELVQSISLFQDLHEVDREICRTWARFIDGEVSLLVATIATQAGLDICRRLILERLPPGKDGQPHINTWFNLAIPIICDAKGRTQNDGELLKDIAKQHGRDDFTYLGAGRTLLKFATAVLESEENYMKRPPIVPSYRFHNSTRLNSHSLQGDDERDDFSLVQILLELKLLEDVKKEIGGKAGDTRIGLSWVEDELMKSTRSLWEGNGVDLQAVFTCQVVMNILKICKGDTQPSFYRELLDSAKSADDIFGFTVDEDNWVSTEGVQFFDIDHTELDNIFHLVRRHITNPTLHIAKKHFLTRRQKYESELVDEDTTCSSNAIDKDGNERTKPSHKAPIPPSTNKKFLLT